jgi:hypothetical protein
MKQTILGTRRARIVTSALLSLIGSSAAHADQGLIPYVTAIPRLEEADVITFAVFQVERYDSNLFRLPSDVEPLNNARRSAITSVSGIGLNVRKAYGQQVFNLNTAVTRSLYSGHGELDETSQRLDASINYTITPAITGEAAINYFKTPTDYEYAGLTNKPNPQTNKNAHVNVDIDAGSGLHPRLGVSTSESRTQDATFQVSNSRTNSVEGGLVYAFRSGNQVYAYAIRGRGRSFGVPDDPIQQIGTSFDQSDVGVRYSLTSAGLYSLIGNVARRIHDGESFSSRNFNATIGDLTASYFITGKTRFELSGGRQVYGAASTFSSYFVENSLTAGLAWDVTGKITVRPQYQIRQQKYGGAVTPVDNPLKETSRYTTLRVDWAAFRSVDVSGSLSKSGRTSNVSSFQYRDYSAAIFARVKF